jgi:hypothetical protein
MRMLVGGSPGTFGCRRCYTGPICHLVSKTEWLNFPVSGLASVRLARLRGECSRQCAFGHSVVEVAGE